MNAKRFTVDDGLEDVLCWEINDKENEDMTCGECAKLLNELHEEKEELIDALNQRTEQCDKYYKENEEFKKALIELKEIGDYQDGRIKELSDENEQLKSQLYCDDEEGVCNICKHHFLVSDDETELGYYNSRCKKGHYECARISLKHCEDFEKEGD